MRLEDKARRKAEKQKNMGLLKDVLILSDMLKDVRSGKYKVSKMTIGSIIFALFYFVFPLDAIFDYLPFLGYLDDAAVLSLVINSLKNEIHRYKSFRAYYEEADE